MTMQPTDKELAEARALFEAWAKVIGLSLERHPSISDWYALKATNDPWRAWQAALRTARQAEPSLREQLQQKCSDWGTYWRAPDAHGVIISQEQAHELLRDALGVEVEIKPATPESASESDCQYADADDLIAHLDTLHDDGQGSEKWAPAQAAIAGIRAWQRSLAPANAGKVVPTENDREALIYLMQQYDAEVHVCERCGKEDPTKDFDSALYLRNYLETHPAPTGCAASASEAVPVAFVGTDGKPAWIHDGIGLGVTTALPVGSYLFAHPASGEGQQGVPSHCTLVDNLELARLRERASMSLRLDGGEVWHWQGDGHDFPESLNCPVVMSADTLRALLATQQQAGQAVADGYVLVPREPTEEMARVFRADVGSATQFTHTTVQCADFASRYRAMLAASGAMGGKP